IAGSFALLTDYDHQQTIMLSPVTGGTQSAGSCSQTSYSATLSFITSSNLPPAYYGQPYSVNILGASTVTQSAYGWNINGVLPNGLYFSCINGQFIGVNVCPSPAIK